MKATAIATPPLAVLLVYSTMGKSALLSYIKILGHDHVFHKTVMTQPGVKLSVMFSPRSRAPEKDYMVLFYKVLGYP